MSSGTPPAPGRARRRERKHIATLTRRRDHLARTLPKAREGEQSYAGAEISALNFALNVIAAADRQGVLLELAYTTPTEGDRP